LTSSLSVGSAEILVFLLKPYVKEMQTTTYARRKGEGNPLGSEKGWER